MEREYSHPTLSNKHSETPSGVFSTLGSTQDSGFLGLRDSSLEKTLLFDINKTEYGLQSTNGGSDLGVTDIYFQPSEYGIVQNYETVKELYKVQLSPTIVTLASHR